MICEDNTANNLPQPAVMTSTVFVLQMNVTEGNQLNLAKRVLVKFICIVMHLPQFIWIKPQVYQLHNLNPYQYEYV